MHQAWCIHSHFLSDTDSIISTKTGFGSDTDIIFQKQIGSNSIKHYLIMPGID